MSDRFTQSLSYTQETEKPKKVAEKATENKEQDFGTNRKDITVDKE